MMKWLMMLMFGWLQLFANSSTYPASLYDGLMIHHAKEAVQSAQNMQESLRANTDAKKSFVALALSWKRVQALYIAGELDEGLVDLPYEIDIYHHAKENIYEQLDRIILSEGSVQKAMFKHSHKTINALEYLVYKPHIHEEKEREMALIAAESITKKLQSVLEVYEKSRDSLISNEKKFNALLINQLSASSYELKEWRVGEASGFSKKYKDAPDAKRAEFALSGLGVASVIAILETHKRVMDDALLVDFGDKSIEYGAKNDVVLIRSAIQGVLKSAKGMEDYSLHVNAKKLYGDLGKLHNGYYVSLISSLRMTSKILDADGD